MSTTKSLREPPSICKWWWSFLSAVIVAVVMCPMTYMIVDSVVGSLTGLKIANDGGCPTTLGFVIHVIVVFLALRGVMELKL